MTLLHTSLRALVLLYATLSTPTWAQGRVTAAPDASQGERQAVRWFNMLDSNGDGRLTHDEVQWALRLDRRLERQFQEADANHDGVVTEAEIRSLSARRKAERLAREAAAAQGAAPQPATPRP